MTPSATAASLHALVTRLVDYAGLFPPAALDMPAAVAAYASDLASEERWMLGRFVAPAARLAELGAASDGCIAPGVGPWRVAALLGPALDADVARVRAFNAGHAGRLVVDVVEAKAGTAAMVGQAANAVGDLATLYVELPIDAEPRPLLEAVREARARAKVRTGGVTREAFPPSAQLARFIVRCAALGVPFKATAGLHHPLRAEHRLTYAADAPTGTMSGFLNVFAAGAFAFAGMQEADVVRLLEERDARALDFRDDRLHWRGHDLPIAALRDARDSFAISFGSCSFREPVDDLHQLALT